MLTLVIVLMVITMMVIILTFDIVYIIAIVYVVFVDVDLHIDAGNVEKTNLTLMLAMLRRQNSGTSQQTRSATPTKVQNIYELRA